jgi:hypothetical protein
MAMSRITTCPHCSTRIRVSEQITEKTLICPHCLADVDNARSGREIRAAEIDTDVKRDLSVGSIVLMVLIGFCVIGIAIAFFFSLGQSGAASIGPALALMFLFAVLEVLVSIAIIRGMVRWGISGVRSPSTARVIGITFLSLGTAAAVVIFFFYTCLFLAD